MLSVRHEWWKKSSHPFCVTGIPKIKFWPLDDHYAMQRWMEFYQEPVEDARANEIVFTIAPSLFKQKDTRYIVPRAATKEAAKRFAAKWDVYFEKFGKLYDHASPVARVVYVFDDGDMSAPDGCFEFFPVHIYRSTELKHSDYYLFEAPACEVKTLFNEGADYYFRNQRDAILAKLL